MLRDLRDSLTASVALAGHAVGAAVAVRAPQEAAAGLAALLHQLQHIAAEFLRIGDPVGAEVDLDRYRLCRLRSFLLHRALTEGLARRAQPSWTLI